MPDKIQIKYNGTWRDLRRLRFDAKKKTDPSGYAGPRWVTLSMNYDVPAGEEPEESQYVPVFQAPDEKLPTSTTMFDANSATAVDRDNWSDGGYARVRGIGVGKWAVTYRFMVTVAGDENEHQLKAGELDGNMYYDGVGFPTVETHNVRLRTRLVTG